MMLAIPFNGRLDELQLKLKMEWVIYEHPIISVYNYIFHTINAVLIYIVSIIYRSFEIWWGHGIIAYCQGYSLMLDGITS